MFSDSCSGRNTHLNNAFEFYQVVYVCVCITVLRVVIIHAPAHTFSRLDLSC